MSTEIPPVGRDAGAAAKLQILATEHWSLLATRTLTYNEALSRVTIFLAILSGALIALALVAQADHFGAIFISHRDSPARARPVHRPHHHLAPDSAQRR
jgi:hypothetical protein